MIMFCMLPWLQVTDYMKFDNVLYVTMVTGYRLYEA